MLQDLMSEAMEDMDSQRAATPQQNGEGVLTPPPPQIPLGCFWSAGQQMETQDAKRRGVGMSGVVMRPFCTLPSYSLRQLIEFK